MVFNIIGFIKFDKKILILTYLIIKIQKQCPSCEKKYKERIGGTQEDDIWGHRFYTVENDNVV